MIQNCENPDVAIGVPTMNGHGRLLRCLRSIERYTPLSDYKANVLVSDDCSGEENLKLNKDVCSQLNVPLLMSPVQLGVAEQWNRLTRHFPEAKWVILLNDDVEVVPDWLEALVFSLQNNEHAGMIGLPAYQGVTTENFTPPPVKSYNEAKMERGYGMLSSTGFAFGFSKKKFDKIGGFDSQFLAFYEEIDFGVRLLEAGWPSYMLSYPIVIHQGGATTSDPGNIDADKVLIESRAKFKAKYSGLSFMRRLMVERKYPELVEWNTMLKNWID